jgi:hypothetical protein
MVNSNHLKSEYLQFIVSNKKLATYLFKEQIEYYQNLQENSIFQLSQDLSFPNIKKEFHLNNINSSLQMIMENIH